MHVGGKGILFASVNMENHKNSHVCEAWGFVRNAIFMYVYSNVRVCTCMNVYLYLWADHGIDMGRYGRDVLSVSLPGDNVCTPYVQWTYGLGVIMVYYGRRAKYC